MQDGLCADSATNIARLGAWGSHVGNVERDFHRHVRAQGLDGSVEPYLVSTKVANKSGVHEDAKVPVLLPHGIVNGLWRASPDKFQSRMVGEGGPSSLENFWTHAIEEPWFQAHPYKDNIIMNPRESIPIRVHGDDAPMNRSRSLLLLQFCSSMCDIRASLLCAFL